MKLSVVERLLVSNLQGTGLGEHTFTCRFLQFWHPLRDLACDIRFFMAVKLSFLDAPSTGSLSNP